MLLQKYFKSSSITEVNSTADFPLYYPELFISTIDELANVSLNRQTAVQS